MGTLLSVPGPYPHSAFSGMCFSIFGCMFKIAGFTFAKYGLCMQEEGMAASVEMNSVSVTMSVETSQVDAQPPIATNLLTESRPINNSKTSSTKDKTQQAEDAQKTDVPKLKIFDNKNFVEAPLPKTNPWGKPVAPTAVENGKCLISLKRRHTIQFFVYLL